MQRDTHIVPGHWHLQAQQLLRKSIRDISAEEGEEDPDREHKDEYPEDDQPMRKTARKGKGKGKGGKKGKRKVLEDAPETPAAQQLEQLAKQARTNQPEAAQHDLPKDLDSAVATSNAAVHADVAMKAASPSGPPQEHAPKDDEPKPHQTATPKKENTQTSTQKA